MMIQPVMTTIGHEIWRAGSWVPRTIRGVLEEWGTLQRIVPVAESFALSVGTRLTVTSLESWTLGVVLHTAETMTASLRPGDRLRDADHWQLSDDLGTGYDERGGGTSWTGGLLRGTLEFRPGVPSDARELSLVGPQGIAITIPIP
jgi:hypothetical protein